MNPNWTDYFARRMEFLFLDIGARVYSNIDPAREYAGDPIVEVQEAAPNFTDYISGRCEITRSFIVACRAPTAALALQMSTAARGVLYNVLKIWEDDGAISCAVYDELAVEPDERGLVVGESFYSYVRFHFKEDLGLPHGV